jgi:hypothetical protein
MEDRMHYRRPLSAWAVAVSLLFVEPPTVVAAHPAIGILTLAAHAHLDEAIAFPGLSVFGGERLSTEPEGRLGVRIGRSALTLGESTEISLITVDDGLHIDMSCGSLHFSAAANERLEVHTGDVLVRPASTQPTQASITILAPMVLQITAEHGNLNFSFHQEFRQLPEGQTYRIYLDSPEGPEDSTIPVSQGGRKKSLVAFFIVGAGAGGVAAWGISDAVRSGNLPISPAKP